MANNQDITPYELLAASERVPGITPLFKFGSNFDIDTGSVPEDVITLGGEKLFPTVASTIDLVSSDAQDSAAGTGIQTLKILGLDVDYNIIEEDKTLNGITPVTTTAEFLRVFRMYGLTGGSAQRAVGNILATHSEGDISAIIAGEGQTLDATYTVPANHAFYLERFFGSVDRSTAASSAQLQIEIRLPNTNVWRVQSTISAAGQGTSFADRFTFMRFVVPEKTDIRVRVDWVENNNTRVSGSFDGYLINLDRFVW